MYIKLALADIRTNFIPLVVENQIRSLTGVDQLSAAALCACAILKKQIATSYIKPTRSKFEYSTKQIKIGWQVCIPLHTSLILFSA